MPSKVLFAGNCPLCEICKAIKWREYEAIMQELAKRGICYQSVPISPVPSESGICVPIQRECIYSATVDRGGVS